MRGIPKSVSYPQAMPVFHPQDAANCYKLPPCSIHTAKCQSSSLSSDFFLYFSFSRDCPACLSPCWSSRFSFWGKKCQLADDPLLIRSRCLTDARIDPRIRRMPTVPGSYPPTHADPSPPISLHCTAVNCTTMSVHYITYRQAGGIKVVLLQLSELRQCTEVVRSAVHPEGTLPERGCRGWCPLKSGFNLLIF